MRSLIATAAALALLSGCVIHSDKSDPPPVAQPGDITFLWNFAGMTCAQEPNVRLVHVTLQRAGAAASEPLENDGYFPCNFAGFDGLKLLNFAAGSYSYAVDAYDGTDSYARVIYSATGSLTVNGSVSVPVNLARVYTAGSLEVFWSFGQQQKNCSQAAIDGTNGVSKVRIQIGTGQPFTVDCSWNSAVFDDLEPRDYSVQLEGLVGDRVWYRGAGRATVTVGNTAELRIALDPVASGATFTPVVAGTFGSFDCATTGVQALFIKLVDSSGSCYPVDLDGNCGYSDSCWTFATAGFKFDYLLADDRFDDETDTWYGDWTVTIEGWDSVSPQVHDVIYYGSQVSRVYAGHPNRTFSVEMHQTY